MNDPRTQPVRAELTKRGDVLEGVIRTSDKPKDARPKQLVRREWDSALAEHVDTMSDGDTVTVEVVINQADSGKRTARLAGVASLAEVKGPAGRQELLARAGGFVNPYTFVPTLPRSDHNGSRLTDTGLEDASPPSHGYHTHGQWSGTLALTLTTVTPLLLPVLAAEQPADGIRTFDVRVDAKGRPLIHGASLKGALRSAYETITASRYGVFFEHSDRLAYRATAKAALGLTPARVHRSEDGNATFRLCRGDATWAQRSERGNEVQHAAWVPAYGVTPVCRLGDLADGPMTRHHGCMVHARVVLHQYSKRNTRFQVWRATHLARTAAELKNLPPDSSRNSERTLTPVAEVAPRFVCGWLSATGYSIGAKHDERLFVETPDIEVPLTDEHVRYWQSVLRAYDLAHGYNDPNATYSRDIPAAENGVVPSLHVPSTPKLRGLPHGTLVYVRYDEGRNEITEVHPVMIGRLPFSAAPGDLLHPSLRPAQDRNRLSPADRLFGWVPPGRNDDGTDTNDGASGYRGRLQVRSVSCTTDSWQPTSFPPEGVTLAPLSSPKPTQFRFYASPDQTTGMPMAQGCQKAAGYTARRQSAPDTDSNLEHGATNIGSQTPDGGIRGRKMYRWREEAPGYWQPANGSNDPARGYLALREHAGHPKQLVRHRGWVRPEVTFQVELFIDGVPEAELGALLWLLTSGPDAPLRIGAGKPYGFGVVTAQLDLDNTRLWDAAGVRAGWLGLTRPDPVNNDRLVELADHFAATCRGNEVLREATESYLAATKPVTSPVHYPRKTPEPEVENYEWFVENERLHLENRGWPLPHVRDSEQRLPYLDRDDSGADQAGRGATNPRNHHRKTSQGQPGQSRTNRRGRRSS